MCWNDDESCLEEAAALGIGDELGRVSANDLRLGDIDGSAVTASIEALTEYRDRATYLYSARRGSAR